MGYCIDQVDNEFYIKGEKLPSLCYCRAERNAWQKASRLDS